MISINNSDFICFLLALICFLLGVLFIRRWKYASKVLFFCIPIICIFNSFIFNEKETNDKQQRELLKDEIENENKLSNILNMNEPEKKDIQEEQKMRNSKKNEKSIIVSKNKLRKIREDIIAIKKDTYEISSKNKIITSGAIEENNGKKKIELGVIEDKLDTVLNKLKELEN